MATPNRLGTEFGNKAEDFAAPTQLPGTAEQRRGWQARNRAWWETTPMRYDWRDAIAAPPGSRAYFEEIDRRFFAAMRPILPWRQTPFDSLIPFDALKSRDVLEIGVGLGTHAQLLAPRSKSFTGIDLTAPAAELTAQRLALFGIAGTIVQMDGEAMRFPAQSFDYIWTWGVIHHSADTREVLREMHRVLRPGGTCTVMVYYRSWWAFYVGGWLRRLFLRGLRAEGGIHRVNQGATDGAIARWYAPADWHAVTAGLFDISSLRIYGLKSELVPLPHGRLKCPLTRLLPDALARFGVHRLRMGSFLVAEMRKV